MNKVLAKATFPEVVKYVNVLVRGNVIERNDAKNALASFKNGDEKQLKELMETVEDNPVKNKLEELI